MFDDDTRARMRRALARPDRELATPPWENARAEVGFDFPADFRWFITEYGCGAVNDYLQIRAVSATYDNSVRASGFEKLVAETWNIDSCDGDEHWDPPECDAYFDGRILTFAADSPDALLLQWGQDDGGNMYYWLRETEDSNAWPVMMHRHNANTWARFEGGFVECLLARMEETFPYLGRPINPEEAWAHTRANPVWKCRGDWNGPIQ